jgi:hypothetical protein
MENEFLNISEITEPLILFFINGSFDPENEHSHHLYDCTRQFWKITRARLRNVDTNEFIYPIALGIYHGEVNGVFKIEDWHPAGTTLTTRTEYNNFENRWEFVGKPIDNSLYKGKILMEEGKVLDGHQYPFRYINQVILDN